MVDSVTEIKDWSRLILDDYAMGSSDAEVAAHLNITLKEYLKQINTNSAFASLVDKGRTLCLAFWEGAARKNLGNKLFNTSLWAFYMKNKFGWADRTEQTNVETGSLNLDELRQRINKQMEEHIKRNTPELTDAQRMLKQLQEKPRD